MAKTRKSTQQTHRVRTILILVILVSIAAVFLLKTGTIPPDIIKLFPPEVQDILKILIPKPTPTPKPRELPTPSPVPPTPVPPPVADWWQVYFTTPINIPDDPEHVIPAGSIEEKLIARIQQAKQRIHIASFEFNLTPVAVALIDAHKRGVEVQWVTDDEHGIEADEEDEGHGQFAMLEDAGIEIKDDARSGCSWRWTSVRS